MHCEKAMELMSAALDGELTARERRELDSHLAQCSPCAQLFEELSGQSRLLRELDCEVPAGLSASILSSLPEQQPAPVKKPVFTLLRRWGTAAACLALVVVGAAVFSGPLGVSPSAKSMDTAAPQSAAESYARTEAADTAEMELAEGYSLVTAEEPAPDSVNKEAAKPVENTAPVESIAPVESAAPAESITPAESAAPVESITPAESAAPAESIAPVEEPAPSGSLSPVISPITGSMDGNGEITFTRTRIDWHEGLTTTARLVTDPASLAAAYGVDVSSFGGSLIAVTLAEGSGSISHSVQEIRPVDGGWEIVIRRQVPELGTCDMAGWLILIDTSLPITGGDTLTVTFS